ncbi:very short patch repair endonuclease [Deltaproteobacteria bacterium Smac51]|nr:very short patch repair endonuclease [Deltaproteobacteria bacterium Smac51]
MADNRSPQARSYNMSRIRSTNTKPEEVVRKYLFAKGFRYRKNDRRYLGKPDIVLPKHRTMVFVHGCFWHYHENCPHFVMPKSNVEFWQSKLEGNRNRDKKNIQKLRAAKWRVIVVWECELKGITGEARLESLINEILNP